MTRATAYRRIPRPDARAIDCLRGIPVADLHDEMDLADRRLLLMHATMRPILPGRTIVGPAVTAWCVPGDNLMMHVALHLAEQGDVLVVSNGGVPHGALWGGNATIQAVRKGIAGIVVDGPIRDIAQVRESDFPVWSTSVSVSRPGKSMPGRVNVPVACAGVTVEPGDIVVADEDGVILVRPGDAERLAEAARARIERDVRNRERIAAGSTLFERLGGDEALRELGVQLADGTWREDA